MAYWYRDSRSIDSYHAGFSFGRLFYTSYPALTTTGLEEKISTFNVSKRFYEDVYKEGFRLGYLAEQKRFGSIADTSEQVNSLGNREDTHMGTINKHKQALTPVLVNSPWVKASTLADLNIPFCIKDIRTLNGMNGEQWALDIVVSPDDLYATGAAEDGSGTVTLGKGNSESRDVLLEALKNDVPQHSVVVMTERTKSGRPFFTLADGQDTGECPCSFYRPGVKAQPKRSKTSVKHDNPKILEHPLF